MAIRRVLRQVSKFEANAYQGYRVSVRLVREAADSYHPRKLQGPADVYDFLRDLAHADREHMYCLHMNVRNQVLSCEHVATGTLTAALAHPREIYKGAILSSAAAIILAHNHPSGDPAPSLDDLAVNRRMKSAGELLGIPLMDSIIIGDGRYWSAKD